MFIFSGKSRYCNGILLKSFYIAANKEYLIKKTDWFKTVDSAFLQL